MTDLFPVPVFGENFQAGIFPSCTVITRQRVLDID